MRYLLIKAAELVDGLSGVRRIHLYLGVSGRSIPGYTNDLLVVYFMNSSRKTYRYSIIRQQFECVGTSSGFLPAKIFDWISRKIH